MTDTTPTSVPNMTPEMQARLAYKRMIDQDRAGSRTGRILDLLT